MLARSVQVQNAEVWNALNECVVLRARAAQRRHVLSRVGRCDAKGARKTDQLRSHMPLNACWKKALKALPSSTWYA